MLGSFVVTLPIAYEHTYALYVLNAWLDREGVATSGVGLNSNQFKVAFGYAQKQVSRPFYWLTVGY